MTFLPSDRWMLLILQVHHPAESMGYVNDLYINVAKYKILSEMPRF